MQHHQLIGIIDVEQGEVEHHNGIRVATKHLNEFSLVVCFENLLHSHGLKNPADALSSDILTVCQYYCVHAVLK